MNNKKKARSAVAIAVRNGTMEKVKHFQCSRCEAQASHWHHLSYEPDQWLEVIPLCYRCHKKLHGVCKKENEFMKTDKKNVNAFTLDKKTSDIITNLADQFYDGNRSMALRFIVTDYQYLAARFVALGRSVSDPVEGEGVA